MKKILLLFIPLVFFFGCDEENNYDSNECLLYGLWYVDYMTNYSADDTECFCEYSSSICNDNNDACPYINFLENGSLSGLDADGDLLAGEWTSDCEDGATITIQYDTGDIYYGSIVSISNNTLMIDDETSGGIIYLTK